MKQPIIPLCIVLLLLGSLIQAEVITGADSLPHGRGCKFLSSGVIYSIARYNNPSGLTGPVPLCTNAGDSFDLAVTAELLGTCMHVCHTLAVSSPRPFYASRQALTSSDTAKPLVLTDTSRFTRIDTVRIDMHTWNDTGCWLPHVAPLRDKADPALLPGCFLVIENSLRQRVLVVFDTMIAISTDNSYYPPTNYAYLAGYKIKWLLQTDRSLNFSKAVNVVNGVIRPDYTNQNARDRTTMFTIRGQMVRISSLAGNGIFVTGSGLKVIGSGAGATRTSSRSR